MKVVPRFLENQTMEQAHNTWTPESSVRIARLLERLPDDGAATVAEFMEQLHLQGLSTNSLGSYADAITSLARIGKPFGELTRKDLVRWVENLEATCSPGTVNLRKILSKRFLRWVLTGELKGGDYPECIAWLKPNPQRRSFPKQILSEVEVKHLVDACKTQRDRTLVFTGYESGARPGELLTMRIEAVEFDRYGAIIRLDGKTGERRVRLVQSVPDLKLWLSMHPSGKTPSAPLWPTERNPNVPVGLRRWQDLLGSLASRAGVNKGINPHLLRHTRATHLACVLTEAQMREFFGWAKNSDMPTVYVHLSGRDCDGTILKHYGIRVEEDRQALAELAPRRCPSCMNQNPPSARFCTDCHSPLDLAAISEAEKMSAEAEDLTTLFIKSVFKRLSPELIEQVLGECGLKEKVLALGKQSEGSGSNP